MNLFISASILPETLNQGSIKHLKGFKQRFNGQLKSGHLVESRLPGKVSGARREKPQSSRSYPADNPHSHLSPSGWLLRPCREQGRHGVRDYWIRQDNVAYKPGGGETQCVGKPNSPTEQAQLELVSVGSLEKHMVMTRAGSVGREEKRSHRGRSHGERRTVGGGFVTCQSTSPHLDTWLVLEVPR